MAVEVLQQSVLNALLSPLTVYALKIYFLRTVIL